MEVTGHRRHSIATWLDEHITRGIQPSVLVDVPDSAFEKTDPIWEKAIEAIRTRVKTAR
jgi:hypothetical protein